MTFQELVDSFSAPTCVLSVRRTAYGGYDEIRIVAGNAKYLEPIEHPVFPEMPDMPGIPEIFRASRRFVPNSLYDEYLPKDIGFEELCYRAAVKKLPIHTYVHMNDLNLWFDIYALPIDREDGDICYCAYTAQPSRPEEIRASSGQSGTAS